MPKDKSSAELGKRIVDSVSEPGATEWVYIEPLGDLSVQAWADNWNGATAQIEISHDRQHATKLMGGLLSIADDGMHPIPSGVYYRAVVTGKPSNLVVSVTPTTQTKQR